MCIVAYGGHTEHTYFNAEYAIYVLCNRNERVHKRNEKIIQKIAEKSCFDFYRQDLNWK